MKQFRALRLVFFNYFILFYTMLWQIYANLRKVANYLSSIKSFFFQCTIIFITSHLWRQTSSPKLTAYLLVGTCVSALYAPILQLLINVMQIYELVMKRRLRIYGFRVAMLHYMHMYVYIASLCPYIWLVHCYHKYQAPLFHKFTCVLLVFGVAKKGRRICK